MLSRVVVVGMITDASNKVRGAGGAANNSVAEQKVEVGQGEGRVSSRIVAGHNSSQSLIERTGSVEWSEVKAIDVSQTEKVAFLTVTSADAIIDEVGKRKSLCQMLEASYARLNEKLEEFLKSAGSYDEPGVQKLLGDVREEFPGCAQQIEKHLSEARLGNYQKDEMFTLLKKLTAFQDYVDKAINTISLAAAEVYVVDFVAASDEDVIPDDLIVRRGLYLNLKATMERVCGGAQGAAALERAHRALVAAEEGEFSKKLLLAAKNECNGVYLGMKQKQGLTETTSGATDMDKAVIAEIDRFMAARSANELPESEAIRKGLYQALATNVEAQLGSLDELMEKLPEEMGDELSGKLNAVIEEIVVVRDSAVSALNAVCARRDMPKDLLYDAKQKVVDLRRVLDSFNVEIRRIAEV